MVIVWSFVFCLCGVGGPVLNFARARLQLDGTIILSVMK